MSTNLAQIDTKAIETKLSVLKARAEAIQVKDQESYVTACSLALECRAEIKAIGFVYDPLIADAKRHLDVIKNEKARYTGPPSEIDAVVSKKAADFKAEERRLAQVETDRINAETREKARIKAEAERKEAEAKAEADRKERERQAEEIRKAEAKEIERQRKSGEIGKREAEKQKKAAEEEAARVKKEAAEQEARQKEQAAQQARETAANVQEVTVKAAVPTVAGIRATAPWKFRIVNEALIPRMFLEPNEVSIGAMVRNTKNKKEAEAKCPGIEVFQEDHV
jgi:hypothetical protein